MSTPVSWPPIGGTPYSIPATGELNWQALSNFLIALGNKAQAVDNTKLAIRIATTSPVTVATASDCVIVCELGVPGAVSVDLPAGITGQAFFVVDGTGDASTNNITITPDGSELINGSSSYVINKDRAGILISFNGVGWTILAEYTNVAAGTIPRSSIAPGSPNQVVINDGSGNLSSEAQLAKSRGGTGADNTSVTFPATGVIPTNDSVSTFTNKSIDGDDNTITDLGIGSLKTDIANADSFLTFDAAGAPIATKAVPVGDVVGTSDTQALTAKDYDGGTASNTSRITVPHDTLANLTALTRKEGTIVYATDTDKLYTDDGVQLTPVGSGSGSGFKNYVPNPNDANANWVASGAGITVATSSSSSRPDNITQPNTIVITRVSGTTAYAYTRFTLDAADYNKLLQIVWDQSYAGTAGDYAVQIWSNTASNYGGSYTQITTPVTNIPSGTFSFNTTFTSPGSGNQYLELRIVAAAGTTPLYLNNVTVTPGVLVQGGAVGAATSYNPSWSASSPPTVGSNYQQKVEYYRNGENMILHFEGAQTIAGSPGTGAYTLPLPAGLTIDTSKTINLNSAGQAVFGYGQVFAGGTQSFVSVLAQTSTSLIFNTLNATTLSTVGSTAFGFDNATWQLSFTAIIPIAEWAGSGTVNMGAGAQVEYASNSGSNTAAGATNSVATSVAGPAGSPIIAVNSTTGSSNTSFVVQFQYPIQTSDQISVEILQGGSWAPAYLIAPGMSQAAVRYGISLLPLTSTTVQVQFGNGGFASSGGTYGAVGSAWSGITSLNWRVKKATASAPVGFGLAGAGSAGLINYYEEYSSTINLIYNNSPTTPFSYKITRIGSQVTFQATQTSTVTANNTDGRFYAATAIPSRFLPLNNLVNPTVVFNNNANATGTFELQTTGTLTFRLLSGSFNGTSAVYGYTASWLVI